MKDNIDKKTVEGFGDEWSRFEQSNLSLDRFGTILEQRFTKKNI